MLKFSVLDYHQEVNLKIIIAVFVWSLVVASPALLIHTCTVLQYQLLKNGQHFGLEFNLEEFEEMTVVALKTLTVSSMMHENAIHHLLICVFMCLQDLGVCIDSVSSAIQQSEQNIQKFTLKCTTESLQLIREEMMTNLKAIVFNSEINFQVNNTLTFTSLCMQLACECTYPLI